MRSKLNFLINVSLKKKIKSKWFVIVNVVIALLLIGIINIDSIISLFGGDFDSKTKIYVIDETNNIYESFKENLQVFENQFYGEDSQTYEVVLTDKTEEEIKEILTNEENESLLISINNTNNDISLKMVSLSKIEIYDYQLISSALTSTINFYNLNNIGLSEEQYNKIVSGVNIQREILDETITNEDENMEMIMTTVFPIMILPFFMLTIFLVQFIGSEVNDEKTTKSMEIIISNVSAKTHFTAKVLSNNLFIFFQLLLMIIYGAIGLYVRKIFGGASIMNGVGSEVAGVISNLTSGVLSEKLVPILVFSIILMLLTFIAYSLIAGILASMTTNQEDYQQIQVPIMITLLFGYYLSIMAGMFKGSLVIKIFSFVPLISAILSPSLLVMGQIGLVEIIISTLIMLVTIYILIKYGLRIYKVGILNYSQTGMWRKIFKSLRNK